MAASRGCDDVGDAHGICKEHVEQGPHVPANCPHVGTDRIADRWSGGGGGGESQGEHRAAGVARPQRVECPPGCVGIAHDDCLQRLTHRCLGGVLPPGVDLDEVEQRAQHAIGAREGLRTRPGMGGVEGEL